MARRKTKTEDKKTIDEMADDGTCGDQATSGGEEGRRGKEEGRCASPRGVSAEAEAGSEVQIETLPADEYLNVRRLTCVIG